MVRSIGKTEKGTSVPTKSYKDGHVAPKRTTRAQMLGDKVAIVTGAGTGIGRGIAHALAREGASVVADYVGNADIVKTVCEEIRSFGGSATSVPADISDPTEVAKLVTAACKAYGKVDILINNAGIEHKMPFLDTPLDIYEKIMEVNLKGVWLCSQFTARQMVKQKSGGRIINISSIHEDFTMPTNAAYCATKGGVRMLMRTLAVELAAYDITVNNVAPGAIDTPMDADLKADPAQYAALLASIPMRRMGKPQDVAAVCVFLASDAASYVSGATYYVDGAMSRQFGSL